ncbi:hypothetical protein QWY84_10630 [Aquisalimonas lutea]|uniref:hypothetical protein n=1 Tax=Aquisalimonas lutea TaxID=1327750 RepID=UPI0025B3538F|nr:hypothetical protein [Aquisalimonas lutea]MDN3518065.1 hypothetical protein [Aquisalimonas lutea]
MENRVPLPTDNIYKFYALFGLLLIIFSIGAMLYVNKSTNDLAFDVAVEYETLKADPMRSVADEARFTVLERKLEIAGKNKKTFMIFLSVIIAAGSLMVWYGFKKWHTEVQPVQDEIARLNLLKLKREVGEDGEA